MSLADPLRAATSTADPLAALAAVRTLRRLADTLELQHVDASLAAGHSWAEIAAALGVSRQAAHKKFAHRFPERNPR